MTKIFKTPFGVLGDKQEVPVSAQTDGSVSYEQGFGVDYQRDYEDPQAKDIPREGLNQLFYDITNALGELQKLGYMQWQAGQYQAGERVAEGGVAYKAIRTTTKKPPHVDWVSVLEGGEFVTADTDQTVGGVKKFAEFPVTPSAAPTANYQTANKKYVDDNALGVGQTWQDVSASRSFDVNYTNTTGRTIMIMFTQAVSISSPGSRVGLAINVSGRAGAPNQVVSYNGSPNDSAVSATLCDVILPGQSYSVKDNGTASGRNTSWWELR